MCCGRGQQSEVVVKKEKCNCKFHWCCYVECETCEQEVEVSFCK